MTNADRIRAMTDEEVGFLLVSFQTVYVATEYMTFTLTAEPI